MAGLVRWVPLRQVVPLRARTQDPQDPIQDFSAAAPGASAPVRSPWQPTDERLQHGPLLVRQIHRRILLDAAYHLFMRRVVATPQQRLPRTLLPLQSRGSRQAHLFVRSAGATQYFKAIP
jgi:hypothetical protein